MWPLRIRFIERLIAVDFLARRWPVKILRDTRESNVGSSAVYTAVAIISGDFISVEFQLDANASRKVASRCRLGRSRAATSPRPLRTDYRAVQKSADVCIYICVPTASHLRRPTDGSKRNTTKKRE